MTPVTQDTSFLPGFSPAAVATKRRLIMSLDALEGAGKTRFTLTAPGPIAFINLDEGLEGVIEPFQLQKKIYLCQIKPEFEGGRDQIIKAAERELAKFEAAYQVALKQARTLVVDTGTELWELMRLAAFGKLAQVLPHQYAEVNQAMTRLLKLAYDSDCNLLITHRLKPEWINDKRTGQFEFSGYKDIPFLVQAHARLWTDGDGFHLRVGKCRQNAGVVGLELVNELINFSMLASFVFPDSSPDDWQ